MIQLKNVTLRRGTKVVLDSASATLNPGEKVGLVGRNGAGKSTLLRVLSGVYEPTSGNIGSDGRISALTDLMLGMDPEASGYEFIVTRGVVMGLTSAQARNLTADVEDFTELGDYLHLPVRTYSSGMLLRLAFAVATAIRTPWARKVSSGGSFVSRSTWNAPGNSTATVPCAAIARWSHRRRRRGPRRSGAAGGPPPPRCPPAAGHPA